VAVQSAFYLRSQRLRGSFEEDSGRGCYDKDQRRRRFY